MSDEFPLLAPLPPLALHPSLKPEQLDAATITGGWLSSLAESLQKGQPEEALDHFLDKESWWRDFISLSWDITSLNGAEAISNYICNSEAGLTELKADQPGALQPHLEDLGGLKFIQSGFSFKSKFGDGRGIVRLANVEPDQWKAWTVFTMLEHLVDEGTAKTEETEEVDGTSGASNHEASTPDIHSDALQVLIIGAGQSGLALAAHLQELGLRYLVVDKAERPGDSWRARYDTVKLHTPLFGDHYPFLKYPTNWPRYLDQEHVIKWMEHYGQIMGLNIKHSTLATNVVYNESQQRYSVELVRKDGVQAINPKHVVLATGLFSDIPIRPNFPGEESFKEKKITIIGSGTSAHDIAQNFVNHGAENVTMVQRGKIFVVSRDSLEDFALPLWKTPGLSTEDADLLGNSLSIPVVRTLSVGGSQMMSMKDKVMLDGLEKAGLVVKRGDGGDSIIDHQIFKTGHFYIDQGACQMIIDGQIKVQRCESGVQEYYPDGIVLGDDTKIESDMIILATGFELCTKIVERIMGPEVRDKVGDICGLNESQERNGAKYDQRGSIDDKA
ncbi:uncharacterized protein N7511_007314 [Penicillium nucicola]|uniref:uncharacterized protein n=1 Tax=Penicillium nucicola TaxID=1850975 RepID=UPI002544E89B|nr:uncharacterized protein N7511_007314 [Penicillium nucicola]KAJ5757132.1 hypothetical protein N7511_007314 [Penicillium nucicola]